MDDKPSFRPFLFSTFCMMIVGWGGLALLLNFTLPTVWPRWGLFALIVLAATGTALPISWVFNRLVFRYPPVAANVVLREAILVGIYAASLAWLSMGRVLNFSLGMWLGLGVVVIEYVIRLREMSARSSVERPAYQRPPEPPKELPPRP